MITRITLLGLAAVPWLSVTPAAAQVDTIVRGRDTVFAGPSGLCKPPPPLVLDLKFFRPSDNVGVPEQDVRGVAQYAIFTTGYLATSLGPGVPHGAPLVRLEVDLWDNGGYRVQASLLRVGGSRASNSSGSKGTLASATELGAIIYSYVHDAIEPLGRPACIPQGRP